MAVLETKSGADDNAYPNIHASVNHDGGAHRASEQMRTNPRLPGKTSLGGNSTTTACITLSERLSLSGFNSLLSSTRTTQVATCDTNYVK